MKATVQWVQDVEFAGESGSGHTMVMDGAPESGGSNRGPRPMEMVLLGLGGCTGFDLVTILRKARQAVQGIRIEVSAERADHVPKVFTRIHVHYVVNGRDLDPRRVERAVNLSAEKYCSVSQMLGKTASITHDFELVDEGDLDRADSD